MTPEVKERIEQIRHGNVPEGYQKLGKDIIPLDWEKKSFSELGIIASGLVDPREEPYCHMQHVGPENIEKDTGRVLDTQSASELGLISGKFYFDPDSIVYSKIRPNLNKVCAPQFEGVCSADCYSIKPTEEIDKTYLLNLMLDYRFYKRAVECSMRTGMPKINQDDLNIITMCYPASKVEQGKIAEILTAQDQVVSQKEKLLAEKQRQKKYLMQQLLSGKKRLPGFSDKWKFAELGKISKKRKEKNKKFEYSLVFSNSAQHGIIPQTEQFDKEIANEERIDGYYIVHDSFFVYNPRISVTAPCGPINRNETGKTGVMSPLYTVFSIESEEINQDFLKQYFKSSCWYRHMKSVANYGARHDRMNVSDEDFFLMPIPVPSLDEQHAIATFLMAADREIELLRQDLEQEKQKKKALMQLLLTGIVRVNV